MIEFSFAKAPDAPWEEVIKARIARSQEVGRAKMKSAAAATLYYDTVDDRFTLAIRTFAFKKMDYFDCELCVREGIASLVFLQLNDGGAAVHVGHAYLKRNQVVARVKPGGYTFVFQVDGQAAHFASLQHPSSSARGQLSPPPTKSTTQSLLLDPPTLSEVSPPERTVDSMDDADDFSEADLMRLRGDKPIHEPVVHSKSFGRRSAN